MKSKTKYYIDKSKIVEIFKLAKLGNVQSVKDLTAGAFNSAYFVSAENKEYVLKVAPKDYSNTLTYEKDIMAREVAFYKLIVEKTHVKTPHVYYFDDSKSVIPSAYFIMERLLSRPLNSCKITKDERLNICRRLGEMVADLHNIKGTAYGYEQNDLHNNWYLAIKSMVNNLIEDCKKNNRKAKAGKRLMEYIEKSRDILMNVEPTFTHFDIWDGNIFYKNENSKIELALIDAERGYWGDCLGDFVSIEMFSAFKKKVSISAYNKIACNPITFTKEELIRYNIMLAYLGLIIYSEKFVRYNVLQSSYLINVILSKLFVGKAFSALKKLL